MQSRIVVLVAAACLLGCVTTEERVEVNGGDAQERLIALRSTFTSVRISSTTTTVVFSCNVVPAAATPCKRRRRRRSPVPANSAPLAAPELSAPQLSASQDVQKAAGSSDADGRLFFTIWTTSFSTVTSTSSVTNFSTTLSISLACTATGQSILPIC